MKLKITHKQLELLYLLIRNYATYAENDTNYEFDMTVAILDELCKKFINKWMDNQDKYSFKLMRYQRLALHRMLKSAVYPDILSQTNGNEILSQLDKDLIHH